MHRHKLVQIRTRVKNELQHLMLNQGMQKKQKLWSTEGRAALASLPLEPWTDRRRKDLLNLLAMLDAQLESLNDAVTRVAKEYSGVPLLMSQPGVGAVTALAFVLTLGDVHRFPRGKQVASYLGLVPREHSSGGKQRMVGSANKATASCDFFSWKQPTSRCALILNCEKNICTAAIRNTSPWCKRRCKTRPYDAARGA